MMFVKLISGKSPVHGRGCFSAERLRRGTVLSYWADPSEVRVLTSAQHRKSFKKQSRVTLETGVRLLGDWFVESIRLADKDPTDYLNHSLRPNVGYAGGVLFALQDIAKGAELFLDYRLLNADFETNVVRGFSPRHQLKASAAQIRRAFKNRTT